MRPSIRAVCGLCALQLFALLCLAMAGAEYGNGHEAILLVTTTADNGSGSLRAALAAATDGDTIQFAPSLNGQTISLTTGELVINKSITISGPGASLLTVTRDQQAPGFRIFNVPPGKTVSIDGLTIAGGYEILGGGIRNGGTLTITDSAIIGNTAGNPTPRPSVTPTPAGFGGGIAHVGTALTIRRSTISNNTATGNSPEGGGLCQFGAPTTITESVISNNHADGNGGGIEVSMGPGPSLSLTVRSTAILLAVTAAGFMPLTRSDPSQFRIAPLAATAR